MGSSFQRWTPRMFEPSWSESEPPTAISGPPFLGLVESCWIPMIRAQTNGGWAWDAKCREWARNDECIHVCKWVRIYPHHFYIDVKSQPPDGWFMGVVFTFWESNMMWRKNTCKLSMRVFLCVVIVFSALKSVSYGISWLIFDGWFLCHFVFAI